MKISVCDDCYGMNKVLAKGEYIRTYVKDGEVFNVYQCKNCTLEYEEKQDD